MNHEYRALGVGGTVGTDRTQGRGDNARMPATTDDEQIRIATEFHQAIAHITFDGDDSHRRCDDVAEGFDHAAVHELFGVFLRMDTGRRQYAAAERLPHADGDQTGTEQVSHAVTLAQRFQRCRRPVDGDQYLGCVRVRIIHDVLFLEPDRTMRMDAGAGQPAWSSAAG